MPRHPAARPTPPPTPIPPTPNRGPDTAVEQQAPARDLTVNKILAGAGAAATSAVLGSYLGAAGTVAGAAIGSVASTMATTLYQRSLDRTRDTVVTRIRTRRAGAPGDLTIPMQRGSEAETVVLRPVVPPAPRRRVRKAVIATVVVFVLALLVVTGLEWAKGSTLQGEAGTSVGRVVGPEPVAPVDSDEDTTDEPSTEPSTEPTPEPSESTDPDATPAPGNQDDPAPDQDADPTTAEETLPEDLTVVPNE